MEAKQTAIALRGITKSFGSVMANNAIDLDVRKGEILALLGENGSGKTTLMNMLSGVYKPDAGQIFVNGEQVSIHSPEDSKRLRIGMVHQHFKLVERFSMADNIWISADQENSLFLTNARYDKIADVCKRFGFEVDPRKAVSDMSVSEKQTVEILKVLYNGADILILDEPTAVLTLQETRKLFSILRNMRDQGCAIIIITHKLNEVLEISDRVTVLRKGCSVATVETARTDAQELTDLMVGHKVSLSIERPECTATETVLELKNVSVKNEEGVLSLSDVSFELLGGEILGVAGVSGCGQKELCEAIAGLKPLEGGEILYRGIHIEGQTPRQIIDHGISMSFIPEDRLGMGLAASLSVTDNMLLKNYRENKGPLVDRDTARKHAQQIVDELEIVTPNTETPVRRLSGGNVQKVLLGREMLANPNVIITAYPVRGLDINSSYTIYNILNREKEKGTAVLFVGEDLDVMLELCDRILVLCHGKVTGIVNAKETSKEALGLLMTDANNTESLRSDEESLRTATFQQVSGSQRHVPKAKKREPLVRMARRGDLTKKSSILLYTFSVLAALVLGGIFIAFNKVNPFAYFATVLKGCFNSPIYINGLIRIVTPLLIVSLALSIAFRMKFWNIGGNGQFIVGAIAASTVGFALNNALPQWLTLLLMALAAILAAGLFGMIPAFCKIRFGTSETLLTLMFNYIAQHTLIYLKKTMFFSKASEAGAVSTRPDFKVLPESSWLYTIKIGSISIDLSVIIALVLVFIMGLYIYRTKQGYEISVVGDSKNTARYAGMNVNKIIYRTMFLSAALVGLAGMLQVTGSATYHRLGDSFTNDVGFTAIIVAWLAKLNPYGIFVVTVLLSILQKGASVAESTFKIASAASDILEGIILFAVLMADIFTQYKLVFRKEEK